MAARYHIDHNAGNDYTVVYVEGFLSSNEFRNINEEILDNIVQHSLTKVVLEIRALGFPYTSDRIWYVEDYLPRVIKAGLRYAAVITPRDFVSGIIVDQIIKKINPDDILVKTFNTVGEAKVWVATV